MAAETKCTRSTLRQNPQRAFTLMELVVVMVLIGFMGTVAFPRLFTQTQQGAAAFYQQVLQGARYAQKYAMFTQCPVQFALNTTPGFVGFTLNMLPNPQPGAQCTLALAPLLKPDNQMAANYTVSVPTNRVPSVTVVATSCAHPDYVNSTCAPVVSPSSFYFDHNGRPRDASGGYISALTIQVGTRTIGIAQETGFVQGDT